MRFGTAYPYIRLKGCPFAMWRLFTTVGEDLSELGSVGLFLDSFDNLVCSKSKVQVALANIST